MTPLAYRVMKDLLTPPADRFFNDQADLLPRMPGVHCFDVTGANPLIDQLRGVVGRSNDHGSIFDRTSFLPADRTWIEGEEDGWLGRFAVHLERVMSADGCGEWAKATLVYRCSVHPDTGENLNVRPLALPIGGIRLGQFGIGLDKCESILADTEFLKRSLADGLMPSDIQTGWKNITHWVLTYAVLSLAIINTPGIVGRSSHVSHKGLAKRLASTFKGDRAYRLNDWTEIKLEISTGEQGEGEASERLTGQKALHFCRSHIRCRLGRLEIVRSHWRGDPALGINQSRYKVSAQQESPRLRALSDEVAA